MINPQEPCSWLCLWTPWAWHVEMLIWTNASIHGGGWKWWLTVMCTCIELIFGGWCILQARRMNNEPNDKTCRWWWWISRDWRECWRQASPLCAFELVWLDVHSSLRGVILQMLQVLKLWLLLSPIQLEIDSWKFLRVTTLATVLLQAGYLQESADVWRMPQMRQTRWCTLRCTTHWVLALSTWPMALPFLRLTKFEGLWWHIPTWLMMQIHPLQLWVWLRCVIRL